MKFWKVQDSIVTPNIPGMRILTDRGSEVSTTGFNSCLAVWAYDLEPDLGFAIYQVGHLS